MKVYLIDYTGNGHPDPLFAARLLAYTKNTRLTQGEETFQQFMQRPEEETLKELAYMANTIPSSWEMCSYTFQITGVSRAFTHQFVRNRHGSYAQQSMRVVDLREGFDFVVPHRYEDVSGDDVAARARGIINMAVAHDKEAYAELVGIGVAVEDARSILPTNIATNIVAKFNLRTMSELAKSRTGGRTQGEYRNVMDAMATEVVRVHPWAEQFLFPLERDYFKEIEEFAEREYAGDLLKKGELLKIVDKMRKGDAQ